MPRIKSGGVSWKGVGYDINPETTRHTDESLLCGWPSTGVSLEFYDDGTVIAIGPTEDDPEVDGMCDDIRIEDQEWIEKFAESGWRGITRHN